MVILDCPFCFLPKFIYICVTCNINNKKKQQTNKKQNKTKATTKRKNKSKKEKKAPRTPSPPPPTPPQQPKTENANKRTSIGYVTWLSVLFRIVLRLVFHYLEGK